MRSVEILTGETANRLIADKIQSDKRFFVSRLGFAELGKMYHIVCPPKRIIARSVLRLRKTLAPFCALVKARREKDRWLTFAPIYYQAYRSADMQAIWTQGPGLEWQLNLYQSCNPSTVAFDARALEPYYWSKPWSRALSGKTVLVVSPFAGDFRKQYARRQQIWQHADDILPAFELKTCPSTFYFTLNPKDQLLKLDELKAQVSGINFDIALLSCGPHGLPLGEFIKEKLAKQAIYVGGALQIMFGVKGKRWLRVEKINKFFNEYWIFPESRPESAISLDGGCYWQ